MPGPSDDLVAGDDEEDQGAGGRDERAETRDRAAEARDERARARDLRADIRERAGGGADTGESDDRPGARQDRRGGASDRASSALDRHASSTDRDFAARQRVVYSFDELTGARSRDAGLVELRRDVVRAKRTRRPFALAFVDVDDLKATNDAHGHRAGDDLLRATADAIRAHVRSYDLIVRFGGDEFVCGLLDLTAVDAAKRFSLVNVDLAAAKHASVTVGLAELGPDDALEDLIARADDDLYRGRREPRSTDG